MICSNPSGSIVDRTVVLVFNSRNFHPGQAYNTVRGDGIRVSGQVQAGRCWVESSVGAVSGEAGHIQCRGGIQPTLAVCSAVCRRSRNVQCSLVGRRG